MENVVYPKWKYHAEKPAVIVRSKEEEASLGQGWAESPAEVGTPVEAAKEGAPAGEPKSAKKPLLKSSVGHKK